MDLVNIGRSRRFLRERPIRVNLFDRPRLVCDLICLETEQTEKRRGLTTSDSLYIVIEGKARLESGLQIEELEEQDVALIPPGVDHTIENVGPGRLTVMALTTPKPSRAGEVKMPVQGQPQSRAFRDDGDDSPARYPRRDREDGPPRERPERPRRGFDGPPPRDRRPPPTVRREPRGEVAKEGPVWFPRSKPAWRPRGQPPAAGVRAGQGRPPDPPRGRGRPSPGPRGRTERPAGAGGKPWGRSERPDGGRGESSSGPRGRTDRPAGARSGPPTGPRGRTDRPAGPRGGPPSGPRGRSGPPRGGAPRGRGESGTSQPDRRGGRGRPPPRQNGRPAPGRSASRTSGRRQSRES